MPELEKRGELPELTDRFPSHEFVYREPEVREVDVIDIVGFFRSLKAKDYTARWTPKNPDDRWRLIFEAAQDNLDLLDEMGWPEYPIRLVEYEGKYYVWSDGHRRVSVAKMLGKYRLKALVTPIWRWRV